MTHHITAVTSSELVDDASVAALVSSRAASRLRAGDATLWGRDAYAEASERLGWVAAASAVNDVIERGLELRDRFASLEYEQVLLCGMGGSSLSPQVMTTDSGVPLVAVDSIHPDFIARVCNLENLAKSIIVVSSKSGGTSETRTQLTLCEHLLREAGLNPAERIVVITDPDSELEEYARSRRYSTVLGDPEVGGRYSALTVFGIVPSILAGADLTGYAADVDSTRNIVSEDSADNPAIRVAASLKQAMDGGGTAQFLSGAFPGLPAWIEQLIAESTGKDGRGLLPLPRLTDEVTSTGGVVVATEQETEGAPADIVVAGSLGTHFYFWEVVTALLCAIDGINPFDQPDVEHTKRAARAMKPAEGLPAAQAELVPGLEVTLPFDETAPLSLTGFLRDWLAAARNARYVAVQAFIPHPSRLLQEFGALTERITGTPCAVSYGPEYLHSTGQLHKGGRADGLFLNIYETPEHDIAVPGTITSFGWLCASASLADMQVLRGLGRKVAGVRIANEKVLEPMVQHLRTLLHEGKV